MKILTQPTAAFMTLFALATPAAALDLPAVCPTGVQDGQFSVNCQVNEPNIACNMGTRNTDGNNLVFLMMRAPGGTTTQGIMILGDSSAQFPLNQPIQFNLTFGKSPTVAKNGIAVQPTSIGSPYDLDDLMFWVAGTQGAANVALQLPTKTYSFLLTMKDFGDAVGKITKCLASI